MSNGWNEFRRQYKGRGIPIQKLSEMYRAQKDKRAKDSDVRKRLASDNEAEMMRQHARVQTLQSNLEKCHRDLAVATDRLAIMEDAIADRSRTKRSSSSKQRTV